MTALVCGVDEAGRGPVVGPMVLSCALFDEDGLDMLEELNVRDSKKIARDRRNHLYPLIKETAIEYKIKAVQPGEIDRYRRNGSLNQLEAHTTARLILSLENTPSKITVDACDSVARDYRLRVLKELDNLNPGFDIPEVCSEHKADDRYLEVGAASVLAKVKRDNIIDKLKKDYGDFGSGYPADEATKKWLKTLSKPLPPIIRKTWNTLNNRSQTSLSEY